MREFEIENLKLKIENLKGKDSLIECSFRGGEGSI
jgi:hypothetical protein